MQTCIQSHHYRGTLTGKYGMHCPNRRTPEIALEGTPDHLHLRGPCSSFASCKGFTQNVPKLEFTPTRPSHFGAHTMQWRKTCFFSLGQPKRGTRLSICQLCSVCCHGVFLFFLHVIKVSYSGLSSTKHDFCQHCMQSSH